VKRFFFALLFCAPPAWAGAQVIVHQAALDQLAGIAPPAVLPVVSPRIVPKPVAHSVRVVKRIHVAMVVRAADALKPVAPPAAAVGNVSARPPGPFIPTPPATPPVKEAVAMPAPALPALPGAVVLRFGAGESDLPAAAAAALAPVCKAAAAGNMVAIDAYAPADASDPSVAMRLSLTRALAVRGALAACGVPPTHILARADGAAGDVTTAKITLARGAQN
jgi:outer membrane protein OmpA-like peptidoglycan-associated protein